MLKSNISKKSNVPRLIWILLAAVAFFSTVNLLQDTSSWSFSEISGVFAQFVRTAPNTGRLVTQLATSEGFEDQSDRCEIIDPNMPTIETAGELNASDTLQLLGENMAGVNPGFDFTGGYDGARHQKILEYGRSLGMSYTIGIFTGRNGAAGAIEFVNDSTQQGFIPIVRLCYINGCNFKDAESVIGFYQEISRGVEVPYIAMIGPNEPGTGNPTEMSGFFDDSFNKIADSQTSYANLVTRINTIADALQDLRVINGGDLYLSPGAFNLNNQQGRDTYELLYSTEHEVLDPGDYDYLMGNVYALGADRVNSPAGANIPAPYAWYRDGDMLDGQGLGNYADEHGLQVILTEFGTIRNDNWPHGRNEQYLIQEATDAFKLFCKDDTVQGVLFFRDFLDNAGQKIDDVVEDELGITQFQHAQIIGDCVKASPYKDWSWANCNFDSCQYTHSFDSRSVASACATEDAALVGDGRPVLKASCSGGMCQTKAIGTIDVAMPIKQFGGNTISGTPQFPYATICSEVAQYTYGQYDALNQFAGLLTAGSGSSSTQNSASVSVDYNDNRDKLGSVVLIGDSMTVHSQNAGIQFVPDQWYESVDRSSAIGGSAAEEFAQGINTTNRTANLASAAATNADLAVVWLGTNDCPAYSQVEYSSYMQKIVDTLSSSGKKVYVIQVPYRRDAAAGACNDAKVDSYNSALQSLTNATFVDLGLASSTSYLDSDSLHINPSNYNAINDVLYELIKTGSTRSISYNSGGVTNVSGVANYYMPWLGSAINCSSQLILYSSDYSRFDTSKITFNPNIGSTMLESFYERTQGTIQNSNWETLLGITGNAIEDVNPDLNASAIQDEKAICVTLENGNEYCFDKVGEASEIRNIQQYDPFKGVSQWDTAECSDEIIYRVNEANFITGPEIVVDSEKTVNTMSSSQLCFEFAKRNNGEESNIVAGYDYPYLVESPTQEKLRSITPACEVNNKKVIDYVENGVNKKKYCAYAGVCKVEDALKGDCKIDPFYTDCFEYLNEYDNANHEIYYKASSAIYPSIPQYDIPGIYDSLHKLYLRVQANLKDKGMKIIFRENVGMQTRVNAKVRDASRSLSDSLNESFPSEEFVNLFAQETQTCSMQTNAYDYSNLLAKNAPIKTQYQYYEWLGYLDILQEIAVAYINDKDLPDAQAKPNPFYGLKLTQEQMDATPFYGKEDYPTSERPTFLEPGLSHKVLSFPLYTCDEIEARRVFDDTFSLFGTMEGELTCLTTLEDERYPDELGEFLCSKGYEVEGLCDEVQCDVPSSTNQPLASNFSLIYPTDEHSIGSGYGEYRKYTDSVSTHVGLDFGIRLNSPIYAAASGEVLFAGWDNENSSRAYGYMVKIKHSNGMVTLYAHMNKTIAKTGDYVQVGDVIGLVGSTGNSTGPHLHFELRRNEKCRWDGNPEYPNTYLKCTLDPEPYLTGQISAAPAESTGFDPSEVSDINLYPVGRNQPIPLCVEPSSLRSVNTDRSYFGGDSKQQLISEFQLIPDAAEALESLLEAMREDSVSAYNSCAFNWGYRSADTQRSLGGCGTDGTACACESEHQLGTTVDFRPSDGSAVTSFSATQCYSWLTQNAKNFGFVESYTDGNPDYKSEPWHWRWVPGDHAERFYSEIDEYSYLRIYLESLAGAANNSNSQSNYSSNVQCINTTASGVLSCQVDLNNTKDVIDYQSTANIANVLVKAYNLDDNLTHTWIGIDQIEEPQALKDSLISKLGGEQQYLEEREQRVSVTNYFLNRAAELGINPHFALTLWVEETAASAVGSHALGCLYVRDTAEATSEMPFDGSVDNMILHLEEQLQCLNSYIKEFDDFTQFMCTYSGEDDRPNCKEFTNNPNFPKNICLYYNEF